MITKFLTRHSQEVSLSELKTALLKLDPSFDQKLVGYSKFLSFLKNNLTIIQLNKKNKIWFVKSIKPEDHKIKELNSSQGSQKTTPITSDLYKKLLKKSGIKVCPDSFCGK